MDIEVFCCSARRDRPLLAELKIHLAPLEREGLMTLWADTDIPAGQDWEQEIHRHLDAAALILLLVSPDFLASDYCYAIEMQRALERHACGQARVIPIILRPASWQRTPLGRLQALPTGAIPITSGSWHHQDDAFYDVAQGVRAAIEETARRKSAPQAPILQVDTARDRRAAAPALLPAKSASDAGRAASTSGNSDRPVRAAPVPSARPLARVAEHGDALSLLHARIWLPPGAPRFAMQACQVTNQDYQRFLQANPFWQRNGQCRSAGRVDDSYLAEQAGERFADYPVVGISWYAAQAYVNWLSQELQQRLRLPMQEEWELAARGGRTSQEWWQEEVEQGHVNCAQTQGRIAWVGAFPENAYGFYSLLGNVYELCATREGGVVACGGAFHSLPRELVLPLALEPDECREDAGFRFVQDGG
ncbi:MAG TPA: SUMF1/EgtB/PvdO family nonheme iron enzyme [Ktedonobacteraceae bacterium]|jgi:hypothetical protein